MSLSLQETMFPMQKCLEILSVVANLHGREKYLGALHNKTWWSSNMRSAQNVWNVACGWALWVAKDWWLRLSIIRHRSANADFSSDCEIYFSINFWKTIFLPSRIKKKVFASWQFDLCVFSVTIAAWKTTIYASNFGSIVKTIYLSSNWVNLPLGQYRFKHHRHFSPTKLSINFMIRFHPFNSWSMLLTVFCHGVQMWRFWTFASFRIGRN